MLRRPAALVIAKLCGKAVQRWWVWCAHEARCRGIGGILSGTDAVTKIEAGADAVQIYTGLAAARNFYQNRSC